MKTPIYLDNNATTPVDPRVLEAMLPYLRECFGNPSSRSHAFGWEAERAVKTARQRVATAIGAHEREIIFTAGATESNNIALQGVARANRNRGRHIISTVVEHKAILDTLKHLEQDGFDITLLPVDRHGRVTAEQVAAALRPETILLSVIWANNEIGTLNPIRELGALARDRGVIFHSDAAQALGKVPIDVDDCHVDLLSSSGHKLYAPKGVGMLYCRRSKPRPTLEPIFFGGGQELGLRPGTSNVPGIVGLGVACELASQELYEESRRLTALRDRLWQRLQNELGDVVLNGHPTERLAGNLNVSIAYVEGEALMMDVPEIAVSSGSACNSAQL
ncbi:MAG: cysteine desulfurase, partial [Myxococcales bacterium]|nr:cysteine desulfurase [Myxococcales bacterium]